MAVSSICLLLRDLSPRPHRISQLVKNLHGRIPVDASICNTDAFLETRWSLWWNLLVPFVDIRLNHHAHNGCLPFAELISYRLSDLGLVTMVLLRVA